MMIRLGGRPLSRFIPALGEVWAGRKASSEDGAITPWQALSTALSGQVGTGNLAGVATAITLGGPGAIFWMWIVALFGMALAFSESSLALKYRETDEYGRINGGPMYYIKNGLGKNWGWLAVIFCIGTLISATATGSMIQANSITEAALEEWLVGVILGGLVFAVIIGGIKSIGSVAGKVVPVMAALYVAIAFIVLIMNAGKVPGAFMEIISHAFGWKEVFGGAAGYGVLSAVRAGIARGLFSNEAGQGSAPIAHAAAQNDNPVMQGEIAMIGVFIDTIVICTMTALVILTVTAVDHAWETDANSAAITTRAYGAAFPGGQWVVPIALFFFAFTTIIGWSYYGEQALTYLVGEWATHPFRYLWVLVVFAGTLVTNTDALWLFGDIANASMAFPNLIAICALSGVVIAMHKANGDPDHAKPVSDKSTPDSPGD
ncbi:UNVERIFIED_CONTAM: hypothetical protein GTU68_009564 [Idotea baltica]|nr:hypothetical protein [Idotea baltica]